MSSYAEIADSAVNQSLAAGEDDPNLPIYTQADMDHAHGIARKARAEYLEAVRVIAALVHVAGGKVVVPPVVIVDGPSDVTVFEDFASGGRVFTTANGTA